MTNQSGETTIIRTVKDRQHPYTLISRDVFGDARLSWEARGVLGYLLSKPDNWEVRFTDLLRQGPGARDRMRRILRELGAAGYLQRRRTQDAAGHLVWITFIYETPPSTGFAAMVTQNTSPSTPFPSTAEPSVVFPSTEKASIYSEESRTSSDLITTEGEGAAPPPSVESFALTDADTLWAYNAAHSAGISPSQIDLRAETDAWQDAVAAGQRPGAAINARADWRQWLRRAIKWAQTHPEVPHDHIRRTPERPAGAQPAGADAADAESAAALRAAVGALSLPGRAPG